jgi:hypothetical protein
LSQSTEEGAELAAYVIVKKIIQMIEWLTHVLAAHKPMLQQFQMWQQYIQQK